MTNEKKQEQKRVFHKLSRYSAAIGAGGILIPLTFEEIPNQIAYFFIVFLPLATIFAIRARRIKG